MAAFTRKYDEELDENGPVRKKSKTQQPKLFPVDFVQSHHDLKDVDVELEALKLVKLKESHVKVHCHCGNMLVKMNEDLSNVTRHTIFDEWSSSYKVLLLRCDDVNNHIAAVRVCQNWWSVEEMLSSCDNSRNGLEEVRTFGERLVLSMLNGIVFNHHEKVAEADDPTFGHHPPNESAKLLWQSGKAIGFYSIKKKGKLISYFSPDIWTLNVLDTIFVRKEYRRRGLATKMVEDFLQCYQDQDVGFSSPLGKPLQSICLKILSNRKKERDRIWICHEPGGLHGRVNLWLSLKRTKRN